MYPCFQSSNLNIVYLIRFKYFLVILPVQPVPRLLRHAIKLQFIIAVGRMTRLWSLARILPKILLFLVIIFFILYLIECLGFFRPVLLLLTKNIIFCLLIQLFRIKGIGIDGCSIFKHACFTRWRLVLQLNLELVLVFLLLSSSIRVSRMRHSSLLCCIRSANSFFVVLYSRSQTGIGGLRVIWLLLVFARESDNLLRVSCHRSGQQLWYIIFLFGVRINVGRLLEVVIWLRSDSTGVQ